MNRSAGRAVTDCVPVTVRFRDLDPGEIERYLERESPWDCAGAFRSEGLGAALTAGIEGTDATALIGLPLIRLAEMLRAEGLPIP